MKIICWKLSFVNIHLNASAQTDTLSKILENVKSPMDNTGFRDYKKEIPPWEACRFDEVVIYQVSSFC